MGQPLTIPGAQVLCYINGRLYSQVESFEWESITPKKPIYGIDSVDPFELAVTTTAVRATLGAYRLHGDGGFQGAGIIAQFHDLPREKYFTFQLVDRKTKLTLFEAAFCSANREQWKVATKNLMRGTLNFEGITWVNEAASH